MIELKEHNIEPYKRLEKAFDENNMVGYESATGTGKSYVAAKYVETHCSVDETLIIVPSNAIRDGWKKILPGVNTISYQALLKRKPDMGKYKMVICDEMHHLGGEKWGEKFRDIMNGYKGKVLGMSATPVRFLDNNRDVVDEFFDGNSVIGIRLPDAISKGVLPSFDYITVLYDLADAKPDAGGNNELTEKLYGQLDVMENEYSFQNIIQKHMKPGDHKVAVFVSGIDMVEEYQKVIEAVYPDALHLTVHSRMKKTEIRRAFKLFEKTRKTCFIYALDMLNEGAHIEGVDTIIMFRKTESPIVFLQQLGRALTTNTDCERITVFDFVANHKNIHVTGDGAEGVIDWICDGVEDPTRQVIKTDYAKAEMLLINKISDILGYRWTKEEDDLIIELYDGGEGIDRLCELLSHKTKGSIRKRAVILGVAGLESKRMQAYKADIRRLYLEPDGMERILELHPESNRRAITAAANRMGLKRQSRGTKWTDEEMNILVSNKDRPVNELMELLPGRTRASIINVKVKNQFTNSKTHIWSEREDQILIDNSHLTVKRIREDFFPNLSETQIYKRFQTLNISKSRIWEEDKINHFIELFTKGGYEAVHEDPMFSSLAKYTIQERATDLGLTKGRRRSDERVRC